MAIITMVLPLVYAMGCNAAKTTIKTAITDTLAGTSSTSVSFTAMTDITTLISTTTITTTIPETTTSSYSGSFPMETSYENACTVFGVKIPVISYLPQGYHSAGIVLEDNTRATAKFMNASVEEIEFKIHWQIYPVPPRFPDAQKMEIRDDITGWLLINGNLNEIIWTWTPGNPNEGAFLLEVFASKSLDVSELILVAKSVVY